MEWDELKNCPKELVELVNNTSASDVARQYNLSNHKAVTYHLEKHGFIYDGHNWISEKNDSVEPEMTGEKEGQEERKPDKEDLGDYWLIRSGDRNFKIDKEKYRAIRRDYCGKDYLTINQICRKHIIPRWKLIILKNAFGFTHDDTPFTDTEIMSNEPEELAEKELQRRKDQYFKKLREKEYDSALRELDKYREEEYLLQKCHEAVTAYFDNYLEEYSIPKLPPHENRGSGKMLEVPIVDLHLSKLCWKPETGENYDRNIAEKRFMAVVDDVVARTRKMEFEKILFPLGNDFFNFDDMAGNTTRGTRQDNDSRWQKMFAVGVVLLTKAIDKFAQVADVDAFVVPGNHDRQTSYYAMMYLNAYYQLSPPVSIDTNPSTRKYRRFGNCLIGFSHMDQERGRIYGNMQVEAAEDWGQTKYREWHGAHLHSEQVKEKHGVIVRNLSSVTANDAWHFEKGYMSLTKHQSFIWDREKGLRNILVTTIV